MTDIKSLWRNQKTEEHVTLERIHVDAERFQQRIRMALLVEYAATGLAVLIFGTLIWALPGSMVKAGSALCIAGLLWITWQLHARMASRRVPDLSATGLIEFQRQELVRQRDAMKSAWLWYLLPIVPGMALMLLGRWYQLHAPWRSLAWDHEVIIFVAIIIVLILVIIRLVQLNRVEALEKKITELENLRLS